MVWHQTLGPFTGKIPGQSLTRTPGSSPTQRPPQFADLNDALEFMWGRLTQPRMVTRLLLLLKSGTSAEFIARAIIFQGFMSGKWSPDVGMLMLKVTVAMIASIAHVKKTKIKILNPDTGQQKFLSQFFSDTPLGQRLNQPSEPEPDADDQQSNAMPEMTGVLGGNT